MDLVVVFSEVRQEFTRGFSGVKFQKNWGENWCLSRTSGGLLDYGTHRTHGMDEQRRFKTFSPRIARMARIETAARRDREWTIAVDMRARVKVRKNK
jgi:hypothetical protein